MSQTKHCSVLKKQPDSYLTKNIFFVSSEVDKTPKFEFEFHIRNSISDLGDKSVTVVDLLGGFQCS
jgi:hypothetical protein